MKETPLWYRLLWILALVIFKIFFRIRIYGRENIPLKGGVILASNHLSYLDPIVLGLLTPRKMNFMAKEELFKNFLFRELITKLGAFPLKRGRLDRLSYDRAVRLIREGRVLALFPEGTRGEEGKPGFLRRGAATLACKTEAPLVPIIIQGTDKALPRGEKIIRLANIKVQIGRPLKVKASFQEKGARRNI
ncbi:MAG: lysophospholipid acyltransferase family protein, partial [Candidatus Aerophobetes bacterium]|nr:lysophospholipid acyltransferase family protein [Candidatus Aerophobetes bacterium]